MGLVAVRTPRTWPHWHCMGWAVGMGGLGFFPDRLLYRPQCRGVNVVSYNLATRHPKIHMIAIPDLQSPELLRRLLRAKDRMDAASHEDWPVQRLAGVSHVSEAHFARAFKEAFGVPPHRYLLTRRIERAVALLRDSDLPITDIAFQTGWRSQGTFGRIFRDITGETPSAVRLRTRAAAEALRSVPACIVSAAHRPDLQTAVVQKRRRLAGDTKGV